jgi:hypothetical protein
MQLQKVWEQMNIAYQKNARQIWVVNVGDLKPLVRSPEITFLAHFLTLSPGTPNRLLHEPCLRL